MSELIKKINRFFKEALRKDVDKVRNEIILSERQETIFERYYVKKQSIGFIADSLNVCPMVINKELKLIRAKIFKVIDN